jgi:hypothetical protein
MMSKFTDSFVEREESNEMALAPPYKIYVTDDIPASSRAYPLAPKEREMAHELLAKLEQTGKIEKCNSPYSAPRFLKVKRDGKSPRLLINYRLLNAKVLGDGNPPVQSRCVHRNTSKRNLVLRNGLSIGILSVSARRGVQTPHCLQARLKRTISILRPSTRSESKCSRFNISYHKNFRTRTMENCNRIAR